MRNVASLHSLLRKQNLERSKIRIAAKNVTRTKTPTAPAPFADGLWSSADVSFRRVVLSVLLGSCNDAMRSFNFVMLSTVESSHVHVQRVDSDSVVVIIVVVVVVVAEIFK